MNKRFILLAVSAYVALAKTGRRVKSSSSSDVIEIPDEYHEVTSSDYFTFAYSYDWDWAWETTYESGPNEDNDHFNFETVGVEMTTNVDFGIYMYFFDHYYLSYYLSFAPIQAIPLAFTVTWYRPEVALVRRAWDFNVALWYEYNWLDFTLTVDEAFKTFEASIYDAIKDDSYEDLYPDSHSDFDYNDLMSNDDAIWSFNLFELLYDTEKPWFFWLGEHEIISWWVLEGHFETIFSSPPHETPRLSQDQPPEGPPPEGQPDSETNDEPPMLPSPISTKSEHHHEKSFDEMNMMEKDHYWRENDPKNSLNLPVPFQSQLEAIFHPKKPAMHNSTSDEQPESPVNPGPGPGPDGENGENMPPFPGGPDGFEGRQF